MEETMNSKKIQYWLVFKYLDVNMTLHEIIPLLNSMPGGKFPIYQLIIGPMFHAANAFPSKQNVNISKCNRHYYQHHLTLNNSLT